jgi:hypothetical protein
MKKLPTGAGVVLIMLASSEIKAMKNFSEGVTIKP